MRRLREKDKQISELLAKQELEKFGLNRFSYDDDMIECYTGVIYDILQCNKTISSKNDKCIFYGVRRVKQQGTSKINGSRLKCGFLAEDLSVRFNIHRSSVSRKIITWANYLYFLLGSINIWPNRETILKHMPQDFKRLYPKTRIIIDCTEIFTEKPSSLALSSKTFSSYKNHSTWRVLVGIAANGAVTFISALYSGCMLDIEITKLCGLLELLEPGDQIMADKGFVLNKLLEGTGITIATPHFLCTDGQFTPSQIEDNQKIASLRIHVERHIKRVKKYKLLQNTVHLTLAGSVNQFWTIANILTLFRRPLIKQKI